MVPLTKYSSSLCLNLDKEFEETVSLINILGGWEKAFDSRRQDFIQQHRRKRLASLKIISFLVLQKFCDPESLPIALPSAFIIPQFSWKEEIYLRELKHFIHLGSPSTWLRPTFYFSGLAHTMKTASLTSVESSDCRKVCIRRGFMGLAINTLFFPFYAFALTYFSQNKWRRK